MLELDTKLMELKVQVVLLLCANVYIYDQVHVQ